MSATFPCPHCGQVYPLKPVLVGKVVRCTACKNPFRLREDGIADRIEVADSSSGANTPRRFDMLTGQSGQQSLELLLWRREIECLARPGV